MFDLRRRVIPKRKNPVALTMEALFKNHLDASGVAYILSMIAGCLANISDSDALTEGIERLYKIRHKIPLGVALMEIKLKKEAKRIAEVLEEEE